MWLLYSFTIILSILSAAMAEPVVLGDKDFAAKMANYDLALVKFYAPWCGHCKRMAPDFAKAANILKQNDPPVTLVKVDCTAEGKDICSKFGVSGYPSIKVFRNGENPTDYNGPRDTAGIVKTMAGQAGPSSVEIENVAKFEKLTGGNSPVAIGFFESDSDAGVKAFLKAADELREKGPKFAHTFNADVLAAAGKSAGQIALFRPKALKSKFEDQIVDYGKDKFTVGLVRNFVKDNAAGLAPVVAPDAQDDLGFPQVLAFFNVDYEKDPKGTQYWRNRVMKVAKPFAESEKWKFGVGNRAAWAGFMNEIGKSDADQKTPFVVAFDDKNTKYLMTEAFSMPTFEAFLEQFKTGSLEAHIKSEDVPDQTAIAGKILTAKNFNTHVTPEKDAFLEFYAPWCGHCKSLAPKWDEMAEAFKDDMDNIVIGKFDATANDVPPQFEVQGFPTLYFVKSGQKPEKYQGPREVKDLIAYVKKHASQPVKTEL